MSAPQLQGGVVNPVLLGRGSGLLGGGQQLQGEATPSASWAGGSGLLGGGQQLYVGLNSLKGTAYYFKMTGMDHNIDGLYDSWVVLTMPDYTGYFYDGPLATPLRSIFIDAVWTI
jgi:hypothetical protein